MRNIAFIGKAGAGRNVAAAHLIKHFNYERVSFVDKIADVAVQLWGEDARTSPFHLLGLEELIREVDEDTWVDYAMLRVQPNGQPLVVTDCHYKSEAQKLYNAGFAFVRIIAGRVLRLERLAQDGRLLYGVAWEHHVRETDLDDWKEDYSIINDDNDRFPAQALDSIIERVSQPVWDGEKARHP